MPCTVYYRNPTDLALLCTLRGARVLFRFRAMQRVGGMPRAATIAPIATRYLPAPKRAGHIARGA